MKKIKLSVIVCTHNPDINYLSRVIEALKKQDLADDYWELIIIDNNSSIYLSSILDISDVTHSRIIRENKIGLTHARMRGISESVGKYILFVDDDNILEEKYFSNAIKIGDCNPDLGCWGSSLIEPIFELKPSAKLLPYTVMLALRNENKNLVGSDMNDSSIMPYGAGLCCTRHVARLITKEFNSNPVLINLDRKGNQMLSGGDIQFSFTSIKNGFKVGVFKELRLHHLIPTRRTEIDYLISCEIGHSASYILLKYANFNKKFWPLRQIIKFVMQFIYCSNFNRQFLAAKLLGFFQGLELLDELLNADKK
jgi:glycosyltransferase involved in cell wall biosynthesis